MYFFGYKKECWLRSIEDGLMTVLTDKKCHIMEELMSRLRLDMNSTLSWKVDIVCNRKWYKRISGSGWFQGQSNEYASNCWRKPLPSSPLFFLCTSLASIRIPDAVTSIGGKAFMGCTSLASITIPDSVTNIGLYAFPSCYGVKSSICTWVCVEWKRIGRDLL